MDKVRRPGADKAFTYWEPVLKEWGVGLSETEFWDYWFNAEKVSDVMINFAKDLKERDIRVFLLSNNFKERADYYGHYPWIHDVIDKTYFSWQTDLVKPDIEAWKLVLEENGLKPEECLYFDDQQKNLDASMEIGIKSFMFTNDEDLQKIVTEHLQ